MGKAKPKAKASPPPVLDPIDGPTIEARGRHAYERRAVHSNERKPYVRVTVNILDMLQQRGSLTLQQARAGEAFALDHRRIWGSPGARDSCILRIGGENHETEAEADRIIAAKKRTNRILNACGPMAYAIMVQVAIYEERLGRERTKVEIRRYDALRAGLDAAADVYGIPVYSDGA